jgi:WD40-like Beta Propeller Repeat
LTHPWRIASVAFFGASILRTDGFGWTISILILSALFVALVSWRLFFLSSMPRPLPDVYLELPPGESPALAPYHPLLAYVSRHGDDWMLHLRELEGGGVTRLRGTEGARSPFFSSDGRLLAFVSSGTMKALSIGGKRTVQRDIAVVGDVRGASWDAAGQIVFGSAGGIRVVSSSGGNPETLVRPADDEGDRLGFPQALAGTGWVIFDARREEERRVEAVRAGTGDRHEVLTDAGLPHYVANGYLLFVRGAAVWATRFDASSARAYGEPVLLVSGIEGGEDAWYDVSPVGTLAFRRPPTGRADHRVAFGVVGNSLTELRRLLPD